jgi:hypothetical protein
MKKLIRINNFTDFLKIHVIIEYAMIEKYKIIIKISIVFVFISEHSKAICLPDIHVRNSVICGHLQLIKAFP